MKEKYTPGHTKSSVGFMSQRSIETHGNFLLPFLIDGLSVLDCGCGPGSLTCDIAERTPNGKALGIDLEESQIKAAKDDANLRGIKNATFEMPL